MYCARAEIQHVMARKFQPGERSEISARAEIRHVIDPLRRHFARKLCYFPLLLLFCSFLETIIT